MPRIGYVPGKFGVRSSDLEPKSHPSECVASLSYDIENRQAICHFEKRGSYVYFDVDEGTFAEWNTAGSRGTYFNLYIRGRYEYDKLS